jgi:hypothetical protein
VAILSEDRFLARIGWTASTSDPGFGAPREDVSIKGKLITFINSVRTLMRSELPPPLRLDMKKKRRVEESRAEERRAGNSCVVWIWIWILDLGG